MNATLITQLGRATVTGALPFPEIVGKLISEGVAFYHVDYALMQFRFYGADGGVVVVPLPLELDAPVAKHLSVTALRAAIIDSQQNGQKFRDFSMRAMRAGVASYIAFLAGKRVVYYGYQGDAHTEWFPGAKPAQE